GGATLLPQRVAAALDWLCRALFGSLAMVLWWGWMEMMFRGHPPDWSRLARYLPMDFEPQFQLFAFAVAVALTSAWVLLLLRLRVGRQRGQSLDESSPGFKPGPGTGASRRKAAGSWFGKATDPATTGSDSRCSGADPEKRES